MTDGLKVPVAVDFTATGVATMVAQFRQAITEIVAMGAQGAASGQADAPAASAAAIRQKLAGQIETARTAVAADPSKAPAAANMIRASALTAQSSIDQLGKLTGATGREVGKWSQGLNTEMSAVLKDAGVKTKAGMQQLKAALGGELSALGSTAARRGAISKAPATAAAVIAGTPAAAPRPHVGAAEDAAATTAHTAATNQATAAMQAEAEAAAVAAAELLQEAAILEQAKAANTEWIAATAAIKTAMMEQGAKVQAALVATDQEIAATATASAAAELLAQGRIKEAEALMAAGAREQEGMATTSAFTRAKAQLMSMYAKEEEQVQRLLAADSQYAQATSLAARFRAQQEQQVAQILAADNEYATATALTARYRSQQNEKVAVLLAADTEYQSSQANLIGLKQRQAAAIETEVAAAGIYAAAQAEVTIAKEREKAQTQQILAGDVAYQAFTVEATVAREQQVAVTQRALAMDQTYIVATAQAANAREQLAARVLLARAGETNSNLTGEQAVARAAVLKRTQADMKKAASTEAMTQEEIRQQVETKVAVAKRNATIRQQERVIMREMTKSGELSGTRFQNFMSKFSTSASRTPQDQPTAGQFFGQKGAQTLGYGLTGFATGALFMGLTDTIKDVTQMEQGFVKLQGQLQTLGKTEAFEGMRADIKDIAGETGVSARLVTDFAARMTGVFGDPEKAIRETDSAMKLMVTTGIDFQTLTQSVIPAAKAFGVSLEEIGDNAIGVNQQFGSPPDEYIAFLGKAGAVAAETGLSLRELTIMSGFMSKSLGKDMASSADVFNKMPALVGANQSKITALMRENAGTAKFINPFREELAGGNPGQALIKALEASTLTEEEGGFNARQKQRLVGMITTRREVEEGTAAVNDASATLETLKNQTVLAEGGTGKLAEQFDKMKDTMTVGFQRAEQNFSNLVETIASAGLTDALSLVTNSFATLLSYVGLLGKAFTALNSIPVLGGAFSAVEKFGVAMLILAKIYNTVTATKSKDVIASGLTKIAENQEAAARVATAEAAAAEAAAIEATTLARLNGAGSGGALLGPHGRPISSYAAPVAAEEAAVLSAAPAANRYGTRLAGSRFGQRFFAGADTGIGRFASGGAQNQAAINAGAAASGATTGVTAFSGIGIAALGALAVHSFYEGKSKEAQDASDDLRKKMSTARQDQLEAIAKTETEFWDKVGIRLFREDLPEETAKFELDKKATVDVTTLAKAGQGQELLDSLTSESVDKINADLAAANPTATDRQTTSRNIDVPLESMDFEQLNSMGEDERAAHIPDFAIDKQWLKDNWDSLVARKEAGDQDAIQIFKTLEDYLKNQQGPALAKLRGDAKRIRSAKEVNDAVDAAKGAANYIREQMAALDLEGSLSAGIITPGEFITESQKFLADKEAEFASRDDKEAAAQELNQIRKKTQDAMDSRLDTEIGMMKAFSSVTSITPKTDELAAELAIFAKQGPVKRLSELPNLIALAYAAWQEKVDRIRDPIARQQALDAGFTLPDELKAGVLEQQIGLSPSAGRLIGGATGHLGYGQDSGALRQAVATASIKDDKSTTDVVVGMLEKRRAEAVKVLDEATKKGDMKGIADATTELGSLDDLLGSALGDLGPMGQMSDALSGWFNKSNEDMSRWIAITAYESGKTVKQVVIELVERRYALARAALAVELAQEHGFWTSEQLQAALDADPGLQQLLGVKTAAEAVPDGADAGGALTPAETRKEADRARGVRESTRTLQRSTISGDSVAVALSELDDATDAYLTERQLFTDEVETDPTKMNQAQAKMNDAQRNVNGARAKIAENELAWALLWARDNPIEQSIAKMADAKRRLAAANREGRVDEAEKIRMEIQEIAFQMQQDEQDVLLAGFASAESHDSADPERLARDQLRTALEKQRQVKENKGGPAAEQAAQDAVDAAAAGVILAAAETVSQHTNLLIALANARGDVVGAAELAVQDIQAKLDAAKARGAEPGVLDGLQAQLVTAQKGALDTSVQNQEDIINFMLEMGEITTEQAVGRLQIEASKYDKQSKEWRDLQMRIKTLQKSTAAGAQYNLPTSLALPTLYEARRMNQSTLMGIGYQDNRNYSLQVNVSGAQDPTAVGAQVVTAFEKSVSGSRVLTPAGGM